jgi:hypothetical protein
MPTSIGNFFVKKLISSPLHPLLGRNIAVITVTGFKTGRFIETPINVIRVGEVLMVISMRNRTWWRNLRGGRPARLHHIGKIIPVRGHVVETPIEVASGLGDYFAQYHGYAKYFKVRRGPDGMLDPHELEKVARGRVLIRLETA